MPTLITPDKLVARELIHKCGHKESHTMVNQDVEFKFENLSKLPCSECRYNEWVKEEQNNFLIRNREVYGKF